MRLERVIASIVQHLLRTQQCDGGWANVGDESTPDATSVVLETLVRHTGEAVAAAAQQAADYLRHMQRPEGSWDSACGVQFVHGTSLAVRGLVAAGVSPNDDAVAAGINWLLMHQQPSGGWGEMPPALTTMGQSNRDEFVPGDATASQTAWALLALVAAGRASSPAARRAVSFLLDTQQNDGRWCETQFVLRDAASGRCYRSSLHTTAAPLRALSRWAVVAPVQADTGEKVSFRVVGAAID